ncbi:metallophosphoesterase [Aminobacter ciceronei]|uniref:Serine/threonine protein phosphatase 1 n=1 Tax=Aminobacter ciceronei TaxID=150723 RepID=A0ABR6C776_9HYPH|nr:metallophosphoesterase [Aminobacter ciceronei]MBA8906459.1 serine/threonine protein phosphatase 1 [Aminobacter ciceronei]MBA9020415.1 serine/threonine protein phosphatase 1 [Aminobacter ciceronei]
MPFTTYALGDVHGRADLLDGLLGAIEDDARASGTEPRILFLGDIVDRGPGSRAAMDLVCRTLERWPLSRLILGNHDMWFRDFMTSDQVDEARFDRWLMRVGGYQTMESYGLLSANSHAQAAATFRVTYPRHLQALQEADGIVIDGVFAYVHAGIDPTRPITDQEPKTLTMIREGFLDHDGPLPRVIVHGHTVTRSLMPEVSSWRIAIDTGAYGSGRLTCLAVSEDERILHFMFATAEGGHVGITRQDAFT